VAGDIASNGAICF